MDLKEFTTVAVLEYIRTHKFSSDQYTTIEDYNKYIGKLLIKFIRFTMELYKDYDITGKGYLHMLLRNTDNFSNEEIESIFNKTVIDIPTSLMNDDYYYKYECE